MRAGLGLKIRRHVGWNALHSSLSSLSDYPFVPWHGARPLLKSNSYGYPCHHLTVCHLHPCDAAWGSHLVISILHPCDAWGSHLIAAWSTPSAVRHVQVRLDRIQMWSVWIAVCGPRLNLSIYPRVFCLNEPSPHHTKTHWLGGLCGSDFRPLIGAQFMRSSRIG